MQAETGGRRPQAKERLGPPEAGGGKRRPCSPGLGGLASISDPCLRNWERPGVHVVRPAPPHTPVCSPVSGWPSETDTAHSVTPENRFNIMINPEMILIVDWRYQGS